MTGEIPINKALTNDPTRTPSRIATENLISLGHIGEMTMRGAKFPHNLPLERNVLFTALVELYTIHFQVKEIFVKPLFGAYNAPTGVSIYKYLARVYISHWFIDVYVSIREAVRRFPTCGVKDYYACEKLRHSHVYDSFLTILLDHLKPTHIIGCPADLLYIPVINFRYDWTHPQRNYFDITNFSLNSELFSGIIKLMSNPAFGWTLSTPSNDPMGRPFWLFDWHDDRAYSWFPREGNYDYDDVSLAYIIGVSCTPHLAFRDDDIIQQFPFNKIPPKDFNFNPTRKIPTRFGGAVNVQRLITSTHEHIEEKTIPAPEEATGATEEDPNAIKAPPQVIQTKYLVNFFQVVDYKYYAQIIRMTDLETRVIAHKMLVDKD